MGLSLYGLHPCLNQTKRNENDLPSITDSSPLPSCSMRLTGCREFLATSPGATSHVLRWDTSFIWDDPETAEQER